MQKVVHRKGYKIHNHRPYANIFQIPNISISVRPGFDDMDYMKLLPAV